MGKSITSKQTTKTIFLIINVLALILLSGSLNQMTLAPGEKAVFESQTEIGVAALEKQQEREISIPNPPYWIIYLFFVPLVFIIIKSLLKIEWAPLRDLDWSYSLLLIGFGLFVIALVGLTINFLDGTEPAISSMMTIRDPKLIFNPEFDGKTAYWLISLLSALLTCSAYLLIKYFRRLNPLAVSKQKISAQIVEEMVETLVQLSKGKDIGETVIRCYGQMCNLLEKNQGIERSESLTPFEFSKQMKHLGFLETHVERLTRLFETVRYSQRNSTENETKDAINALKEIADYYKGRSEAP